jgi:hypothetical protein
MSHHKAQRGLTASEIGIALAKAQRRKENKSSELRALAPWREKSESELRVLRDLRRKWLDSSHHFLECHAEATPKNLLYLGIESRCFAGAQHDPPKERRLIEFSPSVGVRSTRNTSW